jgi:uncharacterized protein (DUF1800 family)
MIIHFRQICRLAVGTLAILLIDAPLAAIKPADTEIARFLNHATFGATETDIALVKQIGYEAYLKQQFELPLPEYPVYADVTTQAPAEAECNKVCRRDNYAAYPLQVNFFRNALTGQDQLRQRVAFALNQILVVSGQDNQIRHPSRLQPYLKLLDKLAFGNYRQLLEEMTLNPAMGVYLDMAGNKNTAPNENYARELLQLFSIGLYELNPDGTQKKDKNRQPIPTFDQAVIGNFSRVFTGWNLAQSTQDSSLRSYSTPMIETANNHDFGQKTLLGGEVVGADKPMSVDLYIALNNVFSNSNVAPFISRQLIQHLVSSNPSPAYVGRVASVFKTSGGDMKQVISAILLDRESLKPPVSSAGHMRGPVLWLTHLLRAFKVNETTSDFVLSDSYLPAQFDLLQDVYKAPSVFNFFPPDYALPNTTLQGPEFAIYSTSEAFKRVNLAYALIFHQIPVSNPDRPKGTWIDISPFTPLATNSTQLVDRLILQMMPEGMSSSMRNTLIKTLDTMPANERVQNAIYWIATSSKYLIER